MKWPQAHVSPLRVHYTGKWRVCLANISASLLHKRERWEKVIPMKAVVICWISVTIPKISETCVSLLMALMSVSLSENILRCLIPWFTAERVAERSAIASATGENWSIHGSLIPDRSVLRLYLWRSKQDQLFWFCCRRLHRFCMSSPSMIPLDRGCVAVD